jgi:hypothetical protein
MTESGIFYGKGVNQGFRQWDWCCGRKTGIMKGFDREWAIGY